MPRDSRIAASEAAAIPLPSEDTTPPETNTYLVIAEVGLRTANDSRNAPPAQFDGVLHGRHPCCRLRAKHPANQRAERTAIRPRSPPGSPHAARSRCPWLPWRWLPARLRVRPPPPPWRQGR